METKSMSAVADTLFAKQRSDGYSQDVMDTTKWVINHFQNYCFKRHISEITIETAAEFINEAFGFDYYNTSLPIQTVLRRPLLILFEFEESGSYCKTHQRGSTTDIPLAFAMVYREYRDYLDQSTNLCLKSKKRKLWVFVKHFEYLELRGRREAQEIVFTDVHDYINDLSSFAAATLRVIKGTLREIYDWLYGMKRVSFSGRQAFPLIRKDPRNKLLSYYSKEEVSQLLSCVDTDTPLGKYAFAVVSLLAYLGIRAGDIINLKFSDIDWDKNIIRYNQMKTGASQSLPMPDEVKLPLLDYIKNARHESADPEYVFVTTCAPYTKHSCTSGVFRMVGKCMETAGIAYEGRHHGPHALRHSLATNLMNENVPISAISNILGHSSTRTTEIYLTVDETNLREITLEVPNV